MCEAISSLHRGDIVYICRHGTLLVEYADKTLARSSAGRPIPFMVVDVWHDGTRVEIAANRQIIEILDGRRFTRDVKFKWSVPVEHLKYVSSIDWTPPEASDRWKILDLE
jgi:hypothetical protein